MNNKIHPLPSREIMTRFLEKHNWNKEEIDNIEMSRRLRLQLEGLIRQREEHIDRAKGYKAGLYPI